MTLYKRYRRWRGYDTTETITHEEPRYEYKVTHLNGNTSYAEGNCHQRDEGFLIVREADDDTWARVTFTHSEMTCKPVFGWRGYDVVKELEGIEEVKRRRIGTDRWIFTVDRADGSWIDTETEYEKHE